MNESSDKRIRKPSVLKRVRSMLSRLIRYSLIVFVLIVLVLIVGLFPVNRGFESSPDGIEILVVSNEVHADLLLPIRAGQTDWAETFSHMTFDGEAAAATHVAIGWGDEGFFLETPTWSDLRASTVANALFWPSDTCLHVRYVDIDRFRHAGRSVKISADQYERMVAYVKSSFVTDEDGKPIQIEGASYAMADAFCKAKGTYHFFNTCNSWIGRALKAAGVSVGLYTPLPKTLYLHLPED